MAKGIPYTTEAIELPDLAADAADEALQINDIDHIEIYTGNARQSAFFYCHAFGFHPVAYRGPMTGHPETASYVLNQGNIWFVLTSPTRSDHPINEIIRKHGDTVISVGFLVDDCVSFYQAALSRDAEESEIPVTLKDSQGSVRRAAIKTYGNVSHPIVERKNYNGCFWPGFSPFTEIFRSELTGTPTGLKRIDHIVGNVALGEMNTWVGFYEKVLGFTEMIHFTDEDISTEYSALMSKVIRNGTGKVKFPINEPASGKRKSQIEEYLEFHNGPGVQHIALETDDIIGTVTSMRERGIEFLRVPKTYYEDIPDRVGPIKQDLKAIAELGILVDRDDDGYLLQLFTKPVSDRPTLFFEVIQREGSQGFGAGNFKALFEAIERDQKLRGNL